MSASPDQQDLRLLHRRAPARPDRAAGLLLRPARRVRLRQDHHPADDRRAGGSHHRHGLPRRPGHHRPAPVQTARQHRLPELRALPAPRHQREHRLRAAAPRHQVGEEAGRRHAGAGPARRLRPPQAPPALRRPAAARRRRPRAHQPPAGPAARRTPRRARPQAAPPDAAGAQAHPDRGRHHLRARHPRPGGGHDHGRHRRGDERGPRRTARRPRRPLREPAHHLRRQLPRHLQPHRGGRRLHRRRADGGRGRRQAHPAPRAMFGPHRGRRPAPPRHPAREDIPGPRGRGRHRRRRPQPRHRPHHRLQLHRVSTQYVVESPAGKALQVYEQNVERDTRLVPGAEVVLHWNPAHTFGLDAAQDIDAGATSVEDGE